MRSLSEVSSSQLSAYTVLIVETLSLDRDRYCHCLQADVSCRYTCLHSDSAAAALLQCQSRQIDGILVDYTLPDATGLEFVQTLQAQFDGAHPPVIIVARESNPAIVVQAMKLGVEDYLSKQTLTAGELQVAMRSAIENARLRLQLQHQEERFRVSVENMLDCFGSFSAIRDSSGQIVDFRIDYLNKAACENNRMPRDQQIGRGLCELLPAHRETGLFAEYCRVVETGDPLVKESLIYEDHYAGMRLVRAFDIHATKLDDGFVASWRDVTPRKQLELQLRQKVADLEQQQHRLQRLIDYAPIGIGMGSADGAVKVANDEMLRLHGYTREEFDQQGMNWRDFIPPESLPLADQVMARLQQEGTLPPAEKDLIRRDGSIMPIWISLVQWLDGTDDHIAFAVDLTRQKQTQSAIEQLNRELRDRLAALQTLASPPPVATPVLDQEAQLQLGMQVAGFGLARIEYAANTVTLSPEAAALFGLAANERTVTRDRIHATFHPDDRERLDRLVQQVLDPAGSGWFADEHRVVWPTGAVRWLSVRKQVFFNRSGPAPHPDYSILAAIDITERKQIEVALRESHRRLANTLESITDAFIAVDEDWRFTFVNPQAGRLLRRTPAELLGKNMWEEFPEGVGSVFDQAYRRAIAEQVTVQIEAFYPPLAAWLELRIYPTSGGLVVYFQDVTARKATEAEREQLLQQEQAARAQVESLAQQLAAEQNRLEQILQQMPVGVGIVEAPSGKVLFFNDKAEHIFGHSVLASETVTDYSQYGGIHPDGRPFQPEDYPVARSLLRGEIIHGEEIRYRRGDGTETIIAVNAAPIMAASGQPIAVVGTFEDIALRKQIEAQRDQLLTVAEAARTAAETANRSKDEFVSMVAHELRSPLNAILGWAKLLQTRPFNAATVQQALEAIVRNTQRQVQLIEDLLDVSRMARGTLRLEFAWVNLEDVVQEALETIRPTAATKGLQLETQLHPIPLIQGDAGRLQQVVLNLLTNAIKFTSAGGQIQVLLDQHESQLRIQVQDTGKGISPDFLPYIFERFQQDQQNPTAKQGLGLGLAIVKYIVEQHGGTVTATSPGAGLGATLTVLLPLPEFTTAVHPAIAPPLPDNPLCQTLTGVQVLLVDDNLDMLDLTTLILEQVGAVVATAPDVASALEQVATSSPDILISDLAMPGQNGYELLQQVRSRYPDRPIPAIALTAYSSEAYREDSLQAGFMEHLTKPVEPEELVRVILTVLQGREADA
ncbi:MAG: PAS domain S-box protein [Leptolyngbyaceae cyanobacterium bins.349]|nr:PAS domain S-box protein [Leptolyngbyaceae cyanobacterium bins.349]